MSAVLGGTVAFDYAGWSARYPELAAFVAQPTAQQFFNEAQLYVDNTPTSPVQDASVGGQRYLYLNMVTAHIAALNAPLGAASSSLVGRISDATEGSVSVKAQNEYPPGSAQWFQQTKYGAAYWQASAQYRTMRYLPGPRRNMDPFNPFRRW